MSSGESQTHRATVPGGWRRWSNHSVAMADSGGRGKTMVAEGLVQVDGVVESRKTAKIRRGQTVQVAGHMIEVN